MVFMAERRKVSSDVSAALVEYVLKAGDISQDRFADALEVSPAFISRVRAGERSFTVDHLASLEKLMDIPLGAILLAAVPLPKPRAETKKLHQLAREAIAQADAAAKTLAGRSHLQAH
jgi:transcriptional regulator with XRE-family HTH domain